VNQALRNWAVASIAAVAVPIVAAAQQLPPAQPFPGPAQPFPPPAAQQPPPAAQPGAPAQRAAPGARPAAAGGLNVAGTWSGPVSQVGSQTKYSVVITLAGTTGETDYPELNCGGKLTRMGASRSYAFYIEVITRGQRDKGGRCPNGSITVARVGDNLGWEWFGSVDGEVFVAYGTLARKPGQ